MELRFQGKSKIDKYHGFPRCGPGRYLWKKETRQVSPPPDRFEADRGSGAIVKTCSAGARVHMYLRIHVRHSSFFHFFDFHFICCRILLQLVAQFKNYEGRGRRGEREKKKGRVQLLTSGGCYCSKAMKKRGGGRKAKKHRRGLTRVEEEGKEEEENRKKL